MDYKNTKIYKDLVNFIDELVYQYKKIEQGDVMMKAHWLCDSHKEELVVKYVRFLIMTGDITNYLDDTLNVLDKVFGFWQERIDHPGKKDDGVEMREEALSQLYKSIEPELNDLLQVRAEVITYELYDGLNIYQDSQTGETCYAR